MNIIRTKFMNFYRKNKHGLILVVFGIIYCSWFRYLEAHVTTHFHVIHMAIDDYIPFCEVFVIPYFLWFAYVAVGIGYFYFHNKSEYYKLCTFLFTGMTIFLVISTVYPNGHHLRPYYFTRDNIFIQMVKMLYRSDTATNLFPSIHVYNSLGVHLAVVNSKELSGRKNIRTASFLLMISIIMSTMFIKQHSVFDVITAFCLAAVMYSLVYVTEPKHSTKKAFVHSYK